MGTSNQPAVETPTLSDGRSENHQNADHLPHSPCFPPRPRLLCPPEQTQPDQGPTAGSKPGPATTRGPTTGSSGRTPTSTTGFLDSLEDSLRPLWLRTPALPPTAAEKQGGELHSLMWRETCD